MRLLSHGEKPKKEIKVNYSLSPDRSVHNKEQNKFLKGVPFYFICGIIFM